VVPSKLFNPAFVFRMGYIQCRGNTLPHSLMPKVFSIGALVIGLANATRITINSSYAEFPNALPGKHIRVNKVFDDSLNSVLIFSDDENIGSAQDLGHLAGTEAGLIRKKNGALSLPLYQKLSNLRDTDSVQVVLRLKPPAGITYLSKFNHTEAELKQNSLDAESAKPVAMMGDVLSANGLSSTAGVVIDDYRRILKVQKKFLTRLAYHNSVASIDELPHPEIASAKLSLIIPSMFQQATQWEDINTLSKSAYSHSQTNLPTNLAVGVNAATYESGLTTAFLSWTCRNLAPVLWDPQPNPFDIPNGHGTGTADDANHSLMTFDVLANSAPGANLYHRYSWTYSNPGDINFIINNSIRTVSMSTNAGAGYYWSPEDLAEDDFAYRYPYPFFANPTGDAGWNMKPVWLGYNAMAVGNVQDSNYTKFIIDNYTNCHLGGTGPGATETLNPPPQPANGGMGCISGSGTSCVSDREMPNIVAPGWAPNVNGIPPAQPPGYTCPIAGPGLNTPATLVGTMCLNPMSMGTSFSAPNLNGMAADVIGQASYLSGYPEGVRAILLATARNVTGGYWNYSIDGLDGAGVVMGQDAITLAKTVSHVIPNGAAVQNGYYYAAMSASDFPPTQATKAFNIQIPSPLPVRKHLRVVVTWDCQADMVYAQEALSDVDLIVQTTRGSYYSTSWNSNVEMVDIPLSGVTAGSPAIATVYPVTWNSVGNPRSSSIYWAITWTWVTDHAH